MEYQRRAGDRHWKTKIDTTVRNRTGLCLNDDDLWAVLATVQAWQIDHDPELLTCANTTYACIVTEHWDDHCGGGLWWDDQHTYENAITNELLLYASTQLYLATGQGARAPLAQSLRYRRLSGYCLAVAIPFHFNALSASLEKLSQSQNIGIGQQILEHAIC